tara:strand:+ start:312 stop:452 length:141 start_codon:yes stop_codon:yes gene_type:complete
MSKTSPKQRYTQLMSWLETYKPSPKVKKEKPQNESRLSYYAKKGIK